ncbi:MAG: hypothetical protein K5669_04190 [Lachnospiraceae bacterium]|nr:hypothetical protein [Lachnospiraceae bacterium]
MRKYLKTISVVAICGLLCTSLSACGDLEDWDDEEYSLEDESGFFDEESYDDESGEEEEQNAADDQPSAGAADLTKRCGLETGTVEASLDANPTRKIRRSMTQYGQTVETTLDGAPLPEDFYFYRKIWDEGGKKAYDQICASLMEGADKIVMSIAISKDDIDKLYYSILYDHPELFWVDLTLSYSYNQDGIVTELKPHYYDYSIESAKSEVANATNGVLNAMWALGSDIDKVKYAHDYLCNHITYTHNNYDQSAYSGFTMGQTVCSGYSRCFQYMMHKMGIPCSVVVGDAGGNHSWDMVELDGEYYMMDVTWDDPDDGTYTYNYFNITGSDMAKDHVIGNNDLMISTRLPAANGTYYSYNNYFGGNAYGTDFSAINSTPAPAPAENAAAPEPAESQTPVADTTDNYTEDYSDDTYIYEQNTGEQGWYNALNPDWTKDDWSWDDDIESWYIIDDEMGATYIYIEEYDQFAVYDNGSDIMYYYDKESGEWIAE